jgi:cell wall-associated NlpC family hydrolase
VKITVVWADSLVQDVVTVEVPPGATVADVVGRSALLAHTARSSPLLRNLRPPRGRAHPLADQDRVEPARALSPPTAKCANAVHAWRVRGPRRIPRSGGVADERCQGRFALARQIGDNFPMSATLLHRLTLCVAAAILLTMSAASAADDAPKRSFAASASSTVRNAATTAWQTAQGLSAAALDLIGIRYQWGGSTPETGLDCSGLVRYVFQQVTGVTLPRTAKDMSRLGDKVAITDLAPGDLVFFNTRRFAYSHVNYLGDNLCALARRGREVEVAALDSGFWQQLQRPPHGRCAARADSSARE